MTDKPAQRAVCLLSGGLDSTTCLAIARRRGYQCFCLTFDYRQRHQAEITAARRIARELGATEHKTVSIDLRAFGGSALTSDIAVPKSTEIDPPNGSIPVTYVPARNTIFLSFALAYAEVAEADRIFIGVNAIDYSGYPDCRPEFIHAFETMANLATKAGVEGGIQLQIETPLLHMTKPEIIKHAVSLGVNLALTHSCYDPAPDGSSCGECQACLLRAKGFEEAGIVDPARA